MKQKSFLNSPLFRILAPILYGVVIYVLVLLIFDSISQLYENFFSGQVVLNIILTFLVLEIIRIIIRLMDIIYPKDFDLGFRITVQIITTGLVSVFITSLVISAYFKFLVGFSNYNTELIVFNSIYLITSVLYNMLYFSIYYLNRLNEVKLAHEYQLKESLKNELIDYKNKINPEFLFNSFENIISLSHIDSDKADEYINTLSKVYRYILSHQRNELISIHSEKETVEDFIKLMNFKYNDNIILTISISNKTKTQNIIPGSILTCVENIIKTTIISPLNPLEISITDKKDAIHIEHKKLNRVLPAKEKSNDLENLKRAYTFFKHEGIQIETVERNLVYKIPFIEMNE